jgi:hypothetical protein
LEKTYGTRIYFNNFEDEWGDHNPRFKHVKAQALQKEDIEDLARLVEKGDSRKAEVDDPVDLVMMDLCNRYEMPPGNYIFWR